VSDGGGGSLTSLVASLSNCTLVRKSSPRTNVQLFITEAKKQTNEIAFDMILHSPLTHVINLPQR
jgi:hypothetical protein